MKVSVIILTWNQKEYTLQCLKSLARQDYRDYDAILVDNASQDGTA